MSTHNLVWWSSSSCRIELQFKRADLDPFFTGGAKDADVAALVAVPRIAAQLERVPYDTLRAELRAYGAWSEAELRDRAANELRLIWLAASDAAESLVPA